MRILKIAGLGILGIIVLMCIVSLFLPSTVTVERSMVIHSKPAGVYNMVNNLKNWNHWSPWNQMDTAMEITYEEIFEGVGGAYAWKSDNEQVGVGSIKIIESAADSFIRIDLNFMEHGTSPIEFKFEEVGENTKMTWQIVSELGMNPMAKFFGVFFMDKMLGTDFEKGLKNIDHYLTKNPYQPKISYAVETTTVPSMPYLSILDSADLTDMSAIGTKYGEMYHEIGEYMAKNNLKMAGAPFGIIIKTEGEKYIWEGAIQTDKLGKSSGRIVAKNSYSGEVAVVKYFGSYEKTEAAWNAAFNWVAENGKTQNGNPWEVYISDPGTEKDTAKWETDIYIPIK